MDYSKYLTQTRQTEQLVGKTQVKNSAGGYVFQITPMQQLQRFLILGAAGGTYYAGERDLTRDNAVNIEACIRQNGVEAVNEIAAISLSGRAPKNDPAIFALALACTIGDAETKQAAYQAITQVCRTGTHLFTFCQAIQNLRGWSAGLRKGVARFYTERNHGEVAYQLVKYRQRNGWTHRDVLRLAHPKDALKNDLFAYAVGKKGHTNSPLIYAFQALQAGNLTPTQAAEVIIANKLPWEAVPTELLKNNEIWEALLPSMPLNAMVRNLARMTANGLLANNLSAATKLVVSKLSDADYIQKSRLHPLAILNALRVYERGYGDKGSLRWDAIPRIVDALDEAFYMAFDNVEKTGKAHLLALDVSGSMSMGTIAGMAITPREASAALALVTARKEDHVIGGFSNNFVHLKISPRDRLTDVIRSISNLPFSSTDCSLPMIAAFQSRLAIDVFHVYTDNETYAGKMHPTEALKHYREKVGINAKLAVVGMTATGFSIADPNDPGMLDVVGFDAATPAILSDFANS